CPPDSPPGSSGPFRRSGCSGPTPGSPRGRCFSGTASPGSPDSGPHPGQSASALSPLGLRGVIGVVAAQLLAHDPLKQGLLVLPVSAPQLLLVPAQNRPGLPLGHLLPGGVGDDLVLPVGLHGQPKLPLGPLGAPAL